MTAFAIAENPKRASCQRPRTKSTPKHAKTIPLKSVKTLARMMLAALRLVSAVYAFAWPAAVRRAASAAVRPRAGSTASPASEDVVSGEAMG